MPTKRCVPPLRAAAVLLLLLFGASVVESAPADEPWEREVARARRQQDREISSCRTRGQPLTNVVRRYKQQVIKDPSALNYYLYGRILVHAGEPDEAVRMMRRSLEVDARFWPADWALAVFYLDKRRYQEAVFHLGEVRRKKPSHRDLDRLQIQVHMELKQFREAYGIARRMLQRTPRDWQVRRVVAVCLLGLKQWELALVQLRALLRQFPRDLAIRRGVIDCLLELEKWDEAIAQLRQFRRLVPEDPLTLWQLGLALYSAGKKKEASVELELLDKMKPGVLHVLDLLQNIYAQLEMRAELLSTLERMRPLIKDDPEKLKQLDELIKLLEEGGQPGASGPGWKRNPLAELLERCVHPDPEIRRNALHEYLEHDLTFVDPVIYRRYDPLVEPDPECRLLVVRILGRYRQGDADEVVVRSVSRYVALALEDPEARVRKVAAEELGRIGAKTGILYLLPQFTGLELTPVPEDHDARTALESEYNACRLALRTLTGHSDVELGAANWIKAADMRANRETWATWLDGPEGVAVRLLALKELRAVTDVDPRWHLRYILVDVMRKEPSPSAIAIESYRVLRDAIAALGAKAAQDPWWSTFPRIPDEHATGGKLAELREQVNAWWGTLQRKKKPAGAQPEKSEKPEKPAEPEKPEKLDTPEEKK